MTERPLHLNEFSQAFEWALESERDPAIASADWLARDLDADCASAVALIVDAGTPLPVLIRAKHAFKTMRVVGETAADRRVGGRLYVAAIAAALVHHGRRISRQSDAALRRGFYSMREDAEVPPVLRDLGVAAVRALDEQTGAPYSIE